MVFGLFGLRKNPRHRRVAGHRTQVPRLLHCELLEDRNLLSGFEGPAALPTSLSDIITPTEMRAAYNVNQAVFGSVAGNGTGQTIAIVDPYSQLHIGNDLAAFDSFYGITAPPSFTVVNETGGSTPPSPSSNSVYGIEISLDVEWAHVIAPNAQILLVEANTNLTTDLLAAVDTARNTPGVSVVSMSFGTSEFAVESLFNTHLTTPPNHTGVTFVAGTGDSGAYSANNPSVYAAESPNVLAVGGTTLTIGSPDTETGWSGSGGGLSQYVSQPSYQKSVVPASVTTSYRAVPDVAMDAGTDVPIYDSYDFGSSTPWIGDDGTSLATPMWAGVIAIADQGRVLNGLGTLDGPSQTLPDIYALPSSDFNDITTGNNGYAAGPGYDLVTGLGTPKVNLVVQGLANAGSPLDAQWTTQIGSFQVPNPTATTPTAVGAAGYDLATVNDGVNAPNVAVQATITLTTNEAAGLVVDYTGTGDGNYYFGSILATGTNSYQANLYRASDGTFTALATPTMTGSPDGTLLFEVYGSSLELFLNGTLVAYANDATLSGGSVGIRTNEGATMSAFSANALTLATPTLPFSDTFTTTSSPEPNQLTGNWINLIGNYGVNTSRGYGNRQRLLESGHSHRLVRHQLHATGQGGSDRVRSG